MLTKVDPINPALRGYLAHEGQVEFSFFLVLSGPSVPSACNIIP